MSALKKTLLNTIKAKKLKFFDLIKRHDSVMKNVLGGEVEDRRPLVRPRAQRCDNIKQWPGHSLEKCTRLG